MSTDNYSPNAHIYHAFVFFKYKLLYFFLNLRTHALLLKRYLCTILKLEPGTNLAAQQTPHIETFSIQENKSFFISKASCVE